MMRSILRLPILCTALAILAACQPDAPIVGRPATEAEKDAMPSFLITVDGEQITILSPLRPELPGCTVELDQRYRMIIPPLESSIAATLPLSAFIDAQGQPARGTPTRVDVTCDGEAGLVRYTGRNAGGPAVVAWIYPDA